VPGWHEATEELQEDGTIRMVGIVQEQHPDRARLFMQWKEMGWPVLVDAYDRLEVAAVPITLAIDERGIVRERLPAPDRGREALERFLASDAPEPSVGADAVAREGAARSPDLDALRARARGSDSAEAWRAYADALAVWGGAGRLDDAIEAYAAALEREPGDGMTHFRLGVAYRMRYDSEGGREGDFRRAVEAWTAALDRDPNQYIWRRRIQQYGPRLDKPYPFYDWVPVAREELRARGEAPAPLVVEPRGSEFAAPQRTFTPADDAVEPDPEGRIFRDENEFIDVEVVAVPPEVRPGEVARIHFIFRPLAETEAHWNNEAEEMLLWVDPPTGWEVDSRAFTHPIPPEPATLETRTLEVELRAPEEPDGPRATLSGYALYYVCEDVNGLCMYRRQDIEVEIGVRR